MSQVIKCDNCDKDLTYTTNCEDYYLELAPKSKAHYGGSVTLMNIQPPIQRTMHFCGLPCMGKKLFPDDYYDHN